jgi:hypothetical protein
METTEQLKAKQRNRTVLIGCGVVALCVMAACGAIVVLTAQADRQFERAVAVLASGDCATAVPLFQEVIDSPFASEDDNKFPARAHIAVCDQFNQFVAQQNSGDVAGALVGYEDMLVNNSSSPLLTAIENQAKGTFASTPAQLASPGTCARLDNYVTHGWIANPDATLPELYRACGEAYTAVGDFTNAVAIYTLFLTNYPNHPAFAEVETALAKASVAEARAAGAGEIAPPQAVGDGSGSGPAVVVIQNDSREQLSLVFSGPEARFETLEPCAECQDYVGTGPEFCPELGPIGTYEVPAGTYEVVVNSISDEGVVPFTGTWDLVAGEEYYSCFFLITE